jgi:hypothetical protein
VTSPLWLCIVKHAWSRWSPPAHAERGHFDGRIIETIARLQDRTCTRCGLVDSRRVW